MVEEKTKQSKKNSGFIWFRIYSVAKYLREILNKHRVFKNSKNLCVDSKSTELNSNVSKSCELQGGELETGTNRFQAQRRWARNLKPCG